MSGREIEMLAGWSLPNPNHVIRAANKTINKALKDKNLRNAALLYYGGKLGAKKTGGTLSRVKKVQPVKAIKSVGKAYVAPLKKVAGIKSKSSGFKPPTKKKIGKALGKAKKNIKKTVKKLTGQKSKKRGIKNLAKNPVGEITATVTDVAKTGFKVATLGQGGKILAATPLKNTGIGKALIDDKGAKNAALIKAVNTVKKVEDAKKAATSIKNTEITGINPPLPPPPRPSSYNTPVIMIPLVLGGVTVVGGVAYLIKRRMSA